MSDLKVTLWSDSTTALWWMKEYGNWSAFVANREKEIRQLTQIQPWKYVPGMKSLLSGTSPLPPDRVTDCAISEVVGIDLAGPPFLKTGEKAFHCQAQDNLHSQITVPVFRWQIGLGGKWIGAENIEKHQIKNSLEIYTLPPQGGEAGGKDWFASSRNY
ncbi:hypothetical protein TNIN_104771 [Trichonephila inaurata madagascariensis]|uniref:Uncharacterized protein n=1 Tax=Trichonephila inaurata madagascariensis TaxID=2747483 RepID=A0A8X6X686_9ARAC|nr:hypothetical protein TNIN_104771 [Trichonephila inaurata madagascariensis]